MALFRSFTQTVHWKRRRGSWDNRMFPPITDESAASLGAPMLAREVRSLPVGHDWVYEFMWGGERIRAIKRYSAVNLISREGRDLTNRFPRVAAAVARLRACHVVIDGEILYLESYPLPVVRFLEESCDESLHGSLAFLAFDLLCDEGRDVRNFSLLCRRLLLADTVQGSSIVFSPLIDVRSEVVRSASARLGFRGIVAKRSGSAYRPDSLSQDWQKTTFALSATLPLFPRYHGLEHAMAENGR
jgi:bifunctional non-homologous end joining protein LigD